MVARRRPAHRWLVVGTGEGKEIGEGAAGYFGREGEEELNGEARKKKRVSLAIL